MLKPLFSEPIMGFPKNIFQVALQSFVSVLADVTFLPYLNVSLVLWWLILLLIKRDYHIYNYLQRARNQTFGQKLGRISFGGLTKKSNISITQTVMKLNASSALQSEISGLICCTLSLKKLLFLQFCCLLLQ